MIDRPRWPARASALGPTLCLMFLSALGAGAAAQDRILSGEHGTFTRLVLPRAADWTWSLEGAGPGPVRLGLSGGDPGTADRIFDRIPRTRLADIAVASDRVTLDLVCACPVEVTSLGSGHLMVDILDPPTTTSARAPSGAQALPLRLESVADVGLGLPPLPRIPPTPALGPRRPQDEPDLAEIEGPDASRHLRIRDFRPPPLVPGGAPSATPTPLCTAEARIVALLQADPEAAHAILPNATAALTDPADRVDAQAARRLGELYLQVGWGAEARAAFELSGGATALDVRIAQAFDGGAGPTPGTSGDVAMRLDPVCGPATALTVLMSGGDAASLAGAPMSEIAAFAAQLPAARVVALRRQLAAQLDRPEMDQLAAALRIGPAAGRVLPPDAAAGGTDAAAAAAATAALVAMGDARATPIAPADTGPIVNAFALRISLPPGPMLDALDDALTGALLRTRRLADLDRLVRSRPELAAGAIAVARRDHDPATAIEVVARLRGHLPPDDPAQDLLEQMLGTRSGAGTAIRVAVPSPTADVGPTGSSEASSEASLRAALWIDRRLSRLAALPGQSPRQRAARAMLQRVDAGGHSNGRLADLGATSDDVAGAGESGAAVSSGPIRTGRDDPSVPRAAADALPARVPEAAGASDGVTGSTGGTPELDGPVGGPQGDLSRARATLTRAVALAPTLRALLSAGAATD